MSAQNNDYYVYVYIDPRNYEEFYYGKGRGLRKIAHLKNEGKTEKDRIINEILDEGLQPVIKVVATDLTEDQALLIETTLIWRLGKSLTNINEGFFADKFRPRNTLNKHLEGFDYKVGTYVYKFHESTHRCWEDFVKYGFISLGQAPNLSQQLRYFEIGDTFVAYLENKGFLGVGIVKEKAVKVNEFLYLNKTLNHYDLVSKDIFENWDNENSEYLARVEWIKTINKNEAIWEEGIGLYKVTQNKADITGRQKTIDYINNYFGTNLKGKENEEN